MKLPLSSLFHPGRIWRAIRFRRQQGLYDRTASDLELKLYSRLLRNDMLHYGYFEQTDAAPETLSVADLEAAQTAYADRIIRALDGTDGRILDAGCGMGGLTGKLLGSGHTVEALTPNRHQAAHVRAKYPVAELHELKYEDLVAPDRYGAVVHSESLQYIPLDAAFDVTARVLRPGGRWIVTDYFRRTQTGHPSGHALDDFRRSISEHGWEVVREEDWTDHVLPTLGMVRFYADRFALPLKEFGLAKFRVKRPFWFALTERIRDALESKVNRELKAVDSIAFARDKRYLFFHLQRADHDTSE